MMPPVVSTESAAQRNSTRSIIHSSVRVVMSVALLRAFLAEQLVDGHANGVLSREHRAEVTLGEAVADHAVDLGAEADVVHLADEGFGVLDIELDELLNL